jgi:hypothetical protein
MNIKRNLSILNSKKEVRKVLMQNNAHLSIINQSDIYLDAKNKKNLINIVQFDNKNVIP